MNIEAVFLDRDGTIGGGNTVVYPGEFQLYDFAKKAIKLLKENDIKIFAFTNQPDISKGLARNQDFIDELFSFGFDEICICPHTHEEGCDCRKPKPTMIIECAKELNINLNNTFVIGDRWSDMLAAENAGSRGILVKTGAGIEALEKYRNRWTKTEFIAENVLEAVMWILKNN